MEHDHHYNRTSAIERQVALFKQRSAELTSAIEEQRKKIKSLKQDLTNIESLKEQTSKLVPMGSNSSVFLVAEKIKQDEFFVKIGPDYMIKTNEQGLKSILEDQIKEAEKNIDKLYEQRKQIDTEMFALLNMRG